ncbi:hypothetical protein M3Y96_00829400 [Aphelenchoides besseyi]|nr:hypothetical protein M3Y96_00829400 [Aphelenchoides besseyi]
MKILLWLSILYGIDAISPSSRSCSFTDEDTGYTLSWMSVTTTFPHEPDTGRYLKMALIESQYGRVSISSAALYNNRQPLKLPKANMITRGYGSIDEERLNATFSVPIYYFKHCQKWTFFVEPTQVGEPYNGEPKTREVCNVTTACLAPKIVQNFRSYAKQQQRQSFEVQLPAEVSNLLSQPIDANFDINGAVHVSSTQNGQFDGRSNQAAAYGTTNYAPTYHNNQPYTTNIQTPFGRVGYSSNDYSQPQNNGFYGNSQPFYGNYQTPYGNSNFANQQTFNNPQRQPFYDSQFQNSNTQNMSTFTIENPNYKFLPENLNIQYEANAGQRRFYDQNGNPYNSQFGTTTEEPTRSNAEQNKINYAEIGQRNNANNPNSQQFTNNIYGYDYRSNPGTRYTINGMLDIRSSSIMQNSGNEQQYQPPQNQRFPTNGRRKRRQSAYEGTAYKDQDLKFPRVENTIPVSMYFDDSTNSNTFATANTFNNQNQATAMYYPYRTDVNNDNSLQNRQYFDSSTNNNQYTSSAMSRNYQLSPHYIPTNQQQFNDNRFANNQNNPTTNDFYTNSNLRANNSLLNPNRNSNLYGVNDNSRIFNPQNHEDIRQYDDPNCQGPDPFWCRDYVKKFEEWFRSYGGSQTQISDETEFGLCPALRNSLYHSDHHCCQSSRALNC